MTSQPPGGRRRAHGSVGDALDAVRANSAGKSRGEIEQLLRDELAARGIELPEPLICSAADVLARPRGLLGHLRMLRFGVRALAAMASAASAISDVLEGADPGVGAVSDPAERPSAWVDVILDDDGRSALRSRRARLGLLAGARDQMAVRLEQHESPRSDIVVYAYVDADRVGTLVREDGVRYVPAISAARARGGRGLLTLGISTVEQDAQPRLRIAR